MIASDYHTGLRAARNGTFGGVPWLRCPFHIQQNPLATILPDAMEPEVTRAIKAILDASDMYYAIEALKHNGAKLKSIAAKLAA